MKPARTPADRLAGARLLVHRLRRALVPLLLALAAIGVPSAAQAQSIDDIFARCPTPAEIAAIDAIMTISIEGDPTGPALVCTAAGGSQNMTKLRRNIYNVLRAAQAIRFSQPLPWSNQTSVWDWLRFESGVSMIRLRTDIGGSSCCSPSNAINLAVSSNVLALADKWVEDDLAGGGLVGGLALIVHEARHHNGGGHTCGSMDQTVDELGSWGAQLYFYVWLDRYADHNLIRPAVGDRMYYRDWHLTTAEDVKRLICNPPVIVKGTVVEFFNSTLDHYFMTIEAAEATAIDNGAAGPGWARTGITFTAWPQAAGAPFNARPVCRFYGSITPGPNSHFYTVDDDECVQLKALQASTPAGQPKWNYEGTAFYAGTPIRGTPTGATSCASIPVSTVPRRVERFYNGRAQLNDSNHRYTVTVNAANEMIQKGWSIEGLVMCANP